MQADNDNIGPDEPVRLVAILRVAFPRGGMSVSGLRREAGRGRLVIMRIAGKDFTTLSSIEEMKQKCRVPANPLASGSVRQQGPRSHLGHPRRRQTAQHWMRRTCSWRG